MLEAAEKTVSRSFLCLGFVVSQSVIVSQTACLFCGAECVVCVVVVCVNNNNNNNNNNNGNPQLVVQLPPQSTTHKTLGVMIDKDVSGKPALPQFQCDGKMTD